MTRTHSSILELSPIAAVPVSSTRTVSYELEAALAGPRRRAAGVGHRERVRARPSVPPDTVNIPGQGTVRIAWIADDWPGPWMYHCHILEHHAAGMMAHFQVLRPGEAPAPHGAHVHSHAHDH